MILMRAIRPRKFDVSAFVNVLEDEAVRVSDDIEDDFEDTTRTWDHQPEFTKVVDFKPPAFITIEVTTDDEIYRYVSEGTRPHRIVPKNAKVLAFQSGYFAKTVPKVIGSHAGGPFGPTVFSKGVNHPGTKAREFDETIAKEWKPEWQRRMRNAMQRARSASGHAI